MSIIKNINKLISPILLNDKIFNLLNRNLTLIFNYHEINKNPSDFCVKYNLNVTPQIFENQLKWIKNSFNIIGPHELISGKYKTPAAMITFDDGFEGVVNNGGKILKSLDIPAVIFMNMAPLDGAICHSALATYLSDHSEEFKSFIENKYNKKINKKYFLKCSEEDIINFLSNNDGKKLINIVKKYHGKFLSDGDLRASEKFGFYIGNHLYNHYNAVNIDKNKLINEYSINDHKIKKYSNYVNIFSYPFGQPGKCYNYQTNSTILSLGAQKILTAIAYFNINRNNKILHRTPMFEHINTEALFRAQCIMPSLLNHIFRFDKYVLNKYKGFDVI